MSKKYIVLVCCTFTLLAYSAEQKQDCAPGPLKRSPEIIFPNTKSAKQLLAPISLDAASKKPSEVLKNSSPKSSPAQIPAVDYFGIPTRSRLSPRERSLLAREENRAQLTEEDDIQEAEDNPPYRDYSRDVNNGPAESESGSEGAFHLIGYSS